MKTVTICMIVKNEESNLDRCLQSFAGIADEIIITDTGSTDKTIEIAKKYTTKIKYFKWVDDFSAARNFCEQYTTKDYILRIDADWVLSPDSIQKLKTLKKNNFHNKDQIFF